MKINIIKQTKVTVMSKESRVRIVNIQLDNQMVDQVFLYL